MKDQWHGTIQWGVLLGFLLVSCQTAEAGPLQANGRFFTDSLGRVVILRGLSVAGNSKVPPFTGITSFSQFDPLPGWGINVIRLLFEWEAYQPVIGQYNTNYLNYINSVVDAASARGIFVIIDLHEGGYSRYLAGGCGNGFPSWALSPSAVLSAPDNSLNCKNWLTKAIADPGVLASFNNLYANTTGVRTQFLNLWRALAQNFSTHAGVIGYDIINEPWGAEATQIFPLYQDVVSVIRSVDPTSIVFLEPQIGVGQGSQTLLPTPTFTNLSYAPHFYDLNVLSGNWTGDPATTNNAFANMTAIATRWNAPLFLGEYGGQALTPRAGMYLDLVYQNLNSSLASGAQWNYTPGWTPQNFDGYDAEDYSIVDNLGAFRVNYKIRPYAQKISGTPTQLTVSNDGTSTQLLWNHVQAMGSTVLFVPRATLFRSTPVKIDKQGSGLSCNYEPSQTFVICASAVNGPKSVTVRACDMSTGVCQ
jgi:endoglycosylceramidase